MDNEKTLNRESLLSGEMHKLAQRRLSGMRLMNDEEAEAAKNCLA